MATNLTVVLRRIVKELAAYSKWAGDFPERRFGGVEERGPFQCGTASGRLSADVFLHGFLERTVAFQAAQAFEALHRQCAAAVILAACTQPETVEAIESPARARTEAATLHDSPLIDCDTFRLTDRTKSG